ncbi:cadherin-like beta sandwich domain-containing protein [Lacrimispora sp. NSJ-141]|uniref:Cadherin-like beta sandwich domain-containing protein n=1 Tax=Lientehia hominis TaxID=2897778 RepID=A0AAP2RH30_9FIRM|nr:cadherin-like beta sandwich domain-containing protein [Lientehia hominis]MCD2491133.1 cadherin-like beta sandwich domain-containing protein [Lientehia hominis]
MRRISKIKKQVLSLVLSFLLLAGTVPMNSLAASEEASSTVSGDPKETVVSTGEIETTAGEETKIEETTEAKTESTPGDTIPETSEETTAAENSAMKAAEERISLYSGVSLAQLTSLMLGNSTSITESNKLPLDKEFDSSVLEYGCTVYRYTNRNLYIKVNAENAQTIEASYVPYGSDSASSVVLTAGNSRGVVLSNLLKNGSNVLTLKLTDADGNEKEYQVTVNWKPALSALNVYTQDMSTATLSPKFNYSTTEYEVVVPSSDTSMTIGAIQRSADGDVQQLTVNGVLSDPDVEGGNVTVALPDEDTFTIPVVAKDTTGGTETSTAYNLKVTKSYDVTFQPDPVFASVTVFNSDSAEMAPVNGVYTLPAGSYTYKITASGYQDLEKSLSVGKGQAVNIQESLVKAADYSDVSYVENMISFIGGVTLRLSKPKIDAAREAYNRLAESEKPKVSNYDVLTEAEHYYNQLLAKTENPSPEDVLNWNQFLGNEDLKGISDAKTPQTGDELTEKWKIQATGGNTMMQHVSAPAYYNDYVYYTSDNKVRKVNPETGVIEAENDVPKSMMLLPQVTCADGKVFAMSIDDNNKTRVRVFNADTLEFLYQTVALSGAQIETPIMYHDGYFYFASYGKGDYYAFIATDEKLDYDISPEWSVGALPTSNQGFLWGGAEFVGDYAYFGDTDGRLFAVNSKTGEIVDTLMLDGYQVQSTPNYYEKNQRLYVTLAMNSGAILSIKMNADGTFNRESEKWFKSDIAGAGIKSSPVIYNDRLYVCGGGGHGGSGEPFRVIDANTMTEIYRIDEIASKGTPVLSTAYATEANNHKVYLYVVPYAPEGAVSDRVSNMYIIQDSVGQTTPIYEKVENIGVGQYCSQSMTIGSNGLIYYYNDANYLYAYGLDDLASRIITGADVDQQIKRQPEVNEYKFYNDAEIRRIKSRYDALSDSEKAVVTQYQKLLDIMAISSMDPAERMNNGIAAIPSIDDITLNDRDMIENLYQGYQLMEEADKERVIGYSILEAAYAQIPILERKVITDAIVADIEKLPAEADILTTDKDGIYSLLERVNALGDDTSAITNLSRLTSAKARVDQVIKQRSDVDALINETLPGVTITLENRGLIDAVDKAAEGLNKKDLMNLESYEYYVSPAKVKLINELIEQNKLGNQLEINKDNIGTLQSLLDEIRRLHDGVLEDDEKYLENYSAVSVVQAKIDAFQEEEDKKDDNKQDDNKQDDNKQDGNETNNGGDSKNDGKTPGGAAKTAGGNTKTAGGATKTLSNGNVKTGDESNAAWLIFVMSAAAALLAVSRKKKSI